MTRLRRLGRGGHSRVRGEPASANGASSFHLRWLVPGDEALAEVSAVLEVLQPPAVPRLYFWALQVSFVAGRRPLGAAHVGLQWNPHHAGGRAVNWGGYESGGAVLTGSASPLPSTPGDPNTRDFPWRPATPYRLAVTAGGEAGWWRGEVRDLATGETTMVRELAGGGDALATPLVWSEVFARCDHPGVAVRWSDLRATTMSGEPVVPRAVEVSYEPGARGGCDNTNADVAPGGGFVQRTNTDRTVPAGSVLPFRNGTAVTPA